MKKNTDTKVTKQNKQPLTLHGLLGALSYWGTTARFLLVSMLVFVAFVLNIGLLEVSSPEQVYGEVQVLVYALVILLMTDLLYVIVARSLPLQPRLDRWALIITDMIIASCFIAPSFFATIATQSNGLRILSPVVAALVVGMRILVGLLYSKNK